MGADIIALRAVRDARGRRAPRRRVGARSVDHLRGPTGAVRAGALLTMLDSAGGVCGGLASLPDGWVVSTNMSARTVDRTPTTTPGGSLRIESRVLRQGPQQRRDHRSRSLTTATGRARHGRRADIRDPRARARTAGVGAPIAHPVSRRRNRYLAMEHWLDAARQSDDRTVEMDLRDALRNPWGILHGGVTAALVDACAEHATGGGVTPRHRPALPRTEPGRAGAGDRDGPRSSLRRRPFRVESPRTGADRVAAVAVVTATRWKDQRVWL